MASSRLAPVLAGVQGWGEGRLPETVGRGQPVPHHTDAYSFSLWWPVQCGTASSPMVRGDSRGAEGTARSDLLTLRTLPALPDDLRSPIRAEREELRNLHFFPPEYGGESRVQEPRCCCLRLVPPDLLSPFQRLPTALPWTSSPLGCAHWRY